MASPSPNTAGPILALLLSAGESTRMGQLKALLPFQGSTLIEYQISSLRKAGVARTMVVLGHEISQLSPLLEGTPGVDWVENPDYRQGKTTSVKAGIDSLRDEATEAAGILVLNVDQPRTSECVRRIMEHHLEHQDGRDAPRLITIPTYRGKGGHPIIFHPALVPEVMEIEEGGLGLKALVRRHEDRTLRLETDNPEVLLDLNTAEDYKAALAHFG